MQNELNKVNPFEGKAVKFDTAEQLEHLAELARGYGLEVANMPHCNLWKFNLFREDANHAIYNKYATHNTLHEIHYSDFVKGIESAKESEPHPDMVNHPKHYNVKGFEVIDIIDAFGLNFNMGNALKYLLRADRKGNKEQDINKALWYLQREINKSN
jgi:hypothetical protein